MLNKRNFNIKSETAFIDFVNKKSNLVIIVPNMPLLTRELTYKSQVQIILSRVARLGLLKTMVLFFNNLYYLPLILKRDFATGIKLLCEIEILFSQKKQYILHSQITDTAVALNNQRLITYFFNLAKKYNFVPCLLTYNPEFLLKYLSYIEALPKDLIIYLPQKGKKSLVKNRHDDIINYLNESPIQFTNTINE